MNATIDKRPASDPFVSIRFLIDEPLLTAFDFASTEVAHRRRRSLFLFAPARSGLRAVALGSVGARLPIGVTGVALPLFALSEGMSPFVAGASIAVYRLAQAVVGPLWGRLGDRIAVSRLFVLSGAAFGVVLAVLALSARSGELLLALSVPLGVATIPHGAIMRAFWNRQPDLADRQDQANDFESFQSESTLLLGRIIAAVLFLVIAPSTLLLCQAGFAVVASAVVAAMPRVRGEGRVFHTKTRQIHGLRVLAVSAPVIVCFVLLSASLGSFSVGLALRLHGVEHGNTWSAVAIGAWGLGSLVGVYTISRGVHRRTKGLFLGLAAPMALAQIFVISTENTWLTCALSLVGGLPIAASISCLYALLEKRRIHAHHTEQLAWATTAIFAGDAIGGAVAGAVAGSASWSAWPMVCSAAFALAACIGLTPLRSDNRLAAGGGRH